ncbi:MAG: hypothetical protein WBN41_04065 [Lysobacterales bacterium]
MKFLFSLILLVSFSTAVSAQTALDEQIALTRQSAHTDRKIIIMGNMTFTADEGAQFWPAWNEYRAAMAANGDRTLTLIKDFAANFETMTDQKANEIMTDHFSIEMQNVVIKQKFAQEIAKFMPALKVMRVIQIENKLDAAINLQLAAEIPLAQ